MSEREGDPKAPLFTQPRVSRLETKMQERERQADREERKRRREREGERGGEERERENFFRKHCRHRRHYKFVSRSLSNGMTGFSNVD